MSLDVEAYFWMILAAKKKFFETMFHFLIWTHGWLMSLCNLGINKAIRPCFPLQNGQYKKESVIIFLWSGELLTLIMWDVATGNRADLTCFYSLGVGRDGDKAR